VNSNCGRLNEEATMHQLDDVIEIKKPTPKKEM
jgi:hypothetical protein